MNQIPELVDYIDLKDVVIKALRKMPNNEMKVGDIIIYLKEEDE